ncbi:MAG: hypothetical protein M3P18_18885 [Actinomycetota bacterium]|nr:hypothetical protein [Actinomycetota bacterium]
MNVRRHRWTWLPLITVMLLMLTSVAAARWTSRTFITDVGYVRATHTLVVQGYVTDASKRTLHRRPIYVRVRLLRRTSSGSWKRVEKKTGSTITRDTSAFSIGLRALRRGTCRAKARFLGNSFYAPSHAVFGPFNCSGRYLPTPL